MVGLVLNGRNQKLVWNQRNILTASALDVFIMVLVYKTKCSYYLNMVKLLKLFFKVHNFLQGAK